MRLIVLGAGAVGSLVGGHLARTGSDVVLVGRPAHVNRINERGLQIKSKDGLYLIRVPAVRHVTELNWAAGDVVLLAVKTQQTAAALHDVPADIPVFCLQNGIRGEEIAAERFPHVYASMVALGARFSGPGEIINFTGNTLAIGRFPTGLDQLVRDVSDHLVTAEFQVFLTPDVMAMKWEKLVINLSNAIYGVTGASILEVRNSPDGRALLAAVWQEGLRVLDAAGIGHQPLPGRAPVQDDIAKLREPAEPQALPSDPDFNYYPSTWQDLYLGRGQTEAPYLNGEIIELGRQTGVPTPVNQLLLQIVDDMAARIEKPGRHSMAELSALAEL